MNEKDAYIAMYYFLEKQYKTLPSEKVLGELLGGMALLEDGNSADPAYWHEWLQAVERAKTDKEGIKFRLLR